MTFIIIALVFQILLVGPVHLIAASMLKSSSDRGQFLTKSYAVYVVWCAVITAVFFVVPFLSIFFGLFFLLVPVAPVAMIIGLGVLHWDLNRLFPKTTEAGKKRPSLVNILIFVIILVLLFYLYGRGNPRSIAVPDDIQQQKTNFEAQVRESGGTMNP
ncbi:MAG: hypothetical protein KBD05_02035 [Candidatus Pacebacteria bacterium]|nr:hypothetical protein [Candidatus Paceibacterota bacterium]